MDPNIRWLRRKILRYLTKRLMLEFVVTVVALWVLLTLLGWSQVEVAPFAIVAAQILVLIRATISLSTNPLSQQAISQLIENPTILVRSTSDQAGLGKIGVELGLFEFRPVLTASLPYDDGADGPEGEMTNEGLILFDVFQSRDGHTTAALGRQGGTITLISQLTDGRILASTDLLIPPSERLIVNQVAGGDLESLVRTHRRLLDGLTRRGIHLRPAPPALLLDLLAIEHDSYQQLGPFFAPFLALDPSPRPFRLALRIDAGQLLGRSGRQPSTTQSDAGKTLTGHPAPNLLQNA